MSLSISGFQPINKDYGLYQGVPIARSYIDAHMRGIAGRVRGRVLEFGRPTYAAGFNCEYEIIDIDPTNPTATIHQDICDEATPELISQRFDFVICTAVLQLVSDPRRAVENMRALLRPGGVLIAAEKCLSKIDSWSAPIDRWRFTPAGLESLLVRFSRVTVTSYGNLYATCAYLLGLPAEQIDPEKLDHCDPEYPVVAIAYAEK